MNKNKDLLADFAKYCEEHPEERFWQALRGWAGVLSILAVYSGGWINETEDTFYWNNKNN